jgi:hypothetical protein
MVGFGLEFGGGGYDYDNCLIFSDCARRFWLKA